MVFHEDGKLFRPFANGGNCLAHLVAARHAHKKYSVWRNPVYRVQFKIGAAILLHQEGRLFSF